MADQNRDSLGRKKGGPPIKFPPLSGDPDRDKIITVRQRLGLSCQALGQQLGVTEAAVRGWESGRRRPPKSALILINTLWPGYDQD